VLFFAVRNRFRSTSTLSRGCLNFPEDYGLPFHKPRSVFRSSWAPLSRARFFFSPASPTSKLSSPRETVPSTLGYPSAVGRCSPGLFPLRSFLLPHLGSSTRSASWTGHAPSSVDSGPLLRGPRPPESGELFPSTSTQKNSSTGSNPLEGLVRTASRRRLLLSWPWVPGEPGSLTFRALKCVESGVSPRRPPAPLRFGASSPAS
jgi:hypothetical protein